MTKKEISEIKLYWFGGQYTRETKIMVCGKAIRHIEDLIKHIETIETQLQHYNKKQIMKEKK